MPKILTQRDDILSQKEVKDLIEHVRDQHTQALIALLYLYGVRISEALLLTKNDFWIEKEKLVCVRVIALKQGRKKDVIPFRHVLKISKDAPFMPYLLAYLDRVKTTDFKIFPRNRFYYWRALKRASMDVYPHLFRRTRLTKLAERGANLLQLMTWAGWKEPRQAGTYLRKSAKVIEDLADKVD